MPRKATAHAVVELSSRRVQRLHLQQRDTTDGSLTPHLQCMPWFGGERKLLVHPKGTPVANIRSMCQKLASGRKPLLMPVPTPGACDLFHNLMEGESRC